MNDIYDYIYQICPQAEELIRFARNAKNPWLFGCGQQATNCIYISGLLDLEIKGCIVTNPRQENFRGLPVLAASSPEVPRDVDLLVAINEKESEAIRTELENLGYLNIYTCMNWEVVNDAIKQAVFWEYCNYNGINTDEPVIWLKNVCLLNPFRHTRNYSQMIYGTIFSDLIVPGIFMDNRYGNIGIYDLLRERANGKNLYDVGAGAGVFSALAAKLGCKTVAFEPAKSILKYLHENARFYNNIIVEECAVCDIVGAIYFYDREDYPKYSTIVPTEGYNRYLVNSVSLNAYITDSELKPDLIRIAVGEIADRIIDGVTEYIINARPDLMIAVESEHLYSELCHKIRKLYSDYKIVCYPGWIYALKKEDYE